MSAPASRAIRGRHVQYRAASYRPSRGTTSRLAVSFPDGLPDINAFRWSFPLQPLKMPKRGTLSFVAPASTPLTVGTERLHLFVKAWVAQYAPMPPGGELYQGGEVEVDHVVDEQGSAITRGCSHASSMTAVTAEERAMGFPVR